MPQFSFITLTAAIDSRCMTNQSRDLAHYEWTTISTGAKPVICGNWINVKADLSVVAKVLFEDLSRLTIPFSSSSDLPTHTSKPRELAREHCH
jgi:transcriptional regulator GlxA family with amidase domain